MRRHLTLAAMVLATACGGSGETPPANAPDAVNGHLRELTQAQANLAHYKSRDGVYGLVLDRTGEKPKVRIDGQPDIIELTMREDRVTRSGQGPAGSLLGYALLAPDGKKVLYVGVDGDVHYFHGQDVLDINADTGAAPLGVATIVGTAPEPVVVKSPVELLDASLTAIAIRTKQPQYSSDDAADLTKVAAALGTADAASFVHFVAAPSHSGKFAPMPKNWQDAFMGSAPTQAGKKGLAKYNATLFPILELNDDNSALKIWGLQVSRPPQAPADNTPGVVWETDHSDVVFVTLDGGRYLIPETVDGGPPLVPGLAPVAQWPLPLQHSALSPPAIEAFAGQGALPPKAAADVSAAQDDWRNCAKAEAPKVKPAMDAIDRDNLNYGTKAARKKAALEKWQAGTGAKCAAKSAKMESLLVGLIDARNKDRVALLEKAKARVTELHLAQ